MCVIQSENIWYFCKETDCEFGSCYYKYIVMVIYSMVIGILILKDFYMGDCECFVVIGSICVDYSMKKHLETERGWKRETEFC